MQCDGAAGTINHSLTTAQQNAAGSWATTIQHQYGDLTTCGITLFP